MKKSIEKLLRKEALDVDEIMQKYIPRKYDESDIVFQLSPPRYGPNLEAINKAIAEPVWEFLDRGGKRWRPVLFLLISEALGKDPKQFADFAIIPEAIHNGSLIIDDVEDGSELRRGKPCTYRLFGLDLAINAGNALYYLPLLTLIKNKERIPQKNLIEIFEIYVQEMINFSFGQATDIIWHKGLAKADEVTEIQYLQMCADKTGTLARMSAKLAAVLAGADKELVEKIGQFAEAIGIAFQMEDDILDLVGEKFSEKKGGPGQDITEGKRTLIVIHTLQKANAKDKKKLIEILNMHTTNQELRDKAIEIMKKYGSIKYVKESARRIVKKSWEEVERLLLPSNAKDKLRVFANYLVEREN